MHLKEYNSGFTLVELLAVIVVLGIIATICVVNVSGVIETSKNSVREQQIANIIKAAEEWTVENTYRLPTSYYYPRYVTVDELVSSGKLSSVPEDPVGSYEMSGSVKISCKDINCVAFVYEYQG